MKRVVTGNEAAAYGAVLARAQAIGCYPITPQTLIVEKLAELVAGRDDVEFTNLESEHSMFGYVIGAARAGVRTFTATSSQGLLYAHEQLHRASRERIPLVAVNVNRAIFAPWSIEPDLSDSMAQRDTGWVQLYASTAQEALDDVICAYRIAERCLLPVLVCAEGFIVSHTSEVVDVPSQDEVDAFLPPLDPPQEWLLDPRHPAVFSALPDSADYFGFQRHLADAVDGARAVIDEVAAAFAAHFDRPKTGAVEVTGDHAAPDALVVIGSIGDTAQELLGERLRIVRVHAYRPFPFAQVEAALDGATRIVAVDRAPAFGSLGPLGADVRAVAPEAANVICGLGGAEVTPDTLRWALEQHDIAWAVA
ncbi:MAG TPA: hypothetical protein VI408_03225 [Gaiellaceae bacterium]